MTAMNSIISVVTPSFNQAHFIADTIESILSQKGDFYIDYVIIDGASTDGSKDIIAGYEKLLKDNCQTKNIAGLCFYITEKPLKYNRCKGISYRWSSEKDNGHGDALNKGFSKTIGDIMCWLNSDDMYLDDAFQAVVEVFRQFSHVKWITGLNSRLYKDGSLKPSTYLDKYKYKNIFSFLTYNYEWIQQECTLWKRDLWQTAGGRINTDYKLMVDGELWCRFFLHENLYHVHKEIGGYRMHGTNRALLLMPQVKAEMEKAIHVLAQQVPPRTLDVAKSLFANEPVKNLDHDALHFKVIEKSPDDNEWQISEVDFFAYSIKEQAEMINKILNGKDYKTGSFLLNPLRWAFLSAKKLFGRASSVFKM